MATKPLVAKMRKVKETTNTIVYGETPDSPSGGLVGSQYVHKFAVSNQLGGSEEVTWIMEAGDQTQGGAAPPQNAVVALMRTKKDTAQKRVYEESPKSPAGGLIGTTYVMLFAVRNHLGDANEVTLLIEAGDQTARYAS